MNREEENYIPSNERWGTGFNDEAAYIQRKGAAYAALKAAYIASGRYANLNAVFNAHCHIRFNRAYVLKVLTHVNHFIQKDEDSIQFFGGNLIGVYPIKWTSEDEYTWINEIINVDDYSHLCRDIWDLPAIDKSYQVSGNPVNLSFLWITHQALVSKELAEKDKVLLASAALNMLQYKCLSSLQSHRFKYPANIQISTAVYESLDNKSALKREGTWKGLVDGRTADILGHDSIHAETIRHLEDDDEVVKMINDIWNRLRSVMNILTTKFHNIKDTNARIVSTGKYTTIDGKAILKDSVNEYAHIKTVMRDMVPDRNDFISEEVIHVTTLTVNTVYPIYLKAMLEYISENFIASTKDKRAINLPELVEDILMFAFIAMRKEKIELHNLPSVATALRGMLRSSRLASPEYLSIKERLEPIIHTANPRIGESNVASTRIGTVMYIVLRALIIK